MAVVNTGFDPLFGDPLRRLIERAKAEGYDASLISGVRDDEDQRQLVANAAATRAGQPLPYLNRGPVRKAAPVGYSPHEYGTAGDVSGIPQSELARLAPQLGLNTIPGDPGHVELANWRQVAANQAPPTPWADVPNVPSAYASNVSASATPGTSLNSSPFLTALQHFESGGRNIPNTHEGTSSGQAQGFNQITTGTWGEFGGLKFAKSPLQATYDQQNAVAANIPLKRWAPETLSYLKDQGFKVNPSQTLGQNIAANSDVGPGPGPGNVGPVTGFLPGQPTGQGPIGSDVVASKDAGAPAAPSIASQLSGPLQALTKDLEDSGKQQQQGGGDQAKQQLQAEQAAAPYGEQRKQALAVQSQQLLAQILAQGRKPLSWGSAPPGAGIGPSMGLGAGQIPQLSLGASDPSMADQQLAMLMQQDAPGTTLNSMG